MLFWRPKKGIVYQPKSVSSPTKYSTCDKTLAVVINIDDKKYIGTFSVNDGFCEVRCEKAKLLLPLRNVSFNKQEYFHPVRYQGDQLSLTVIYTVKIKRYGEEDFNRFKEKYKGKKVSPVKVKVYVTKFNRKGKISKKVHQTTMTTKDCECLLDFVKAEEEPRFGKI